MRHRGGIPARGSFHANRWLASLDRSLAESRFCDRAESISVTNERPPRTLGVFAKRSRTEHDVNWRPLRDIAISNRSLTINPPRAKSTAPQGDCNGNMTARIHSQLFCDGLKNCAEMAPQRDATDRRLCLRSLQADDGATQNIHGGVKEA